MKIEITEVTPTLAAQWLSTNHSNNRKKSKRLIAQYARDMIAGKWDVTGEAIKFDTTGRLIDGQHRLSAVVEAHKNVRMAVITGLEPKVIHVLDTGKSRTGADALTITGQIENAVHVAALARKIIGFKAGAPEIMQTKKIRLKGEAITNREILDFASVNDLQPYVRFSHRLDKMQIARVFSATEWAFVFWLLSQTDAAAAEEFCTRLASLDNVGLNNPIRTLFEKLVRSQVRLSGKQTLMATVSAWNAWRTGATLKVIRVSNMDEAIPQAV